MAKTVEQARKITLDITAAFEGTNYWGLAANFDGQGFTFGILGFCLGQETLQNLLKDFYKEDPKLFSNCATVFVSTFGKETDLTEWLLDLSKMSAPDAVAWSLKRQKKINGKWIIDPHWIQVFKNLGKEEKFQEIQRRHAGPRFDKAYKYCEEYNMLTVRALAFFFDTCVQQGSLKLTTKARAITMGVNKTPYPRKLEILAQALSLQARKEYQKDVLSRRICIARGKGLVHGKNWDLGKEFDLTDESIPKLNTKPKLYKFVDNWVSKPLRRVFK